MQWLISVYEEFYLYNAYLLDSYGFAILALSLFVSLMMMYPLRWANKISRIEQKFQNVLVPQIELIKEQSSGAEQHQRIDDLYRRYAYHPIFAIRKITGLLIQLPILLITFFMFEGLELLNGESFLFIDNLGSSDALLYGNGNLLPYIMTGINLTTIFFTPNLTKSELRQAASISLLFFILLYNSKSALLLYWIASNTFLLVNNLAIYLKIDTSQRIDFRAYGRKLLLFILKKEVFIFFVIFFVYILIFKLVLAVNYSYNSLLTSTLLLGVMLMLLALISAHFLTFIKGKWFKIYHINNMQAINYPKVSMTDSILILIPLAPIIQYAILNKELLTINHQLLFIGVFAAIAFLITLVLPYILQKILPVVSLIPLGLSLTYVYFSMPAFTIMGAWARDPDLILLGAVILTIFAVLNLLYKEHLKFFYASAITFFCVSVVFSSYNLLTSQDHKLSKINESNLSEESKLNFIATGSMQTKPDIYLLTYDSYVIQETMQQYGIDNSSQENFLNNKGFKIYPKTYSVAWKSIMSMTRVLEMSRDLYKPENGSDVFSTLVPTILKQQGYSTYGVLLPYFYVNNLGVEYDYNYPTIKVKDHLQAKTLIEGVREGRFRFDLFHVFSKDNDKSIWIEKKREIMRSQPDYPKFLHSHTGPHHSQNSGKCLPNEIHNFEERLAESNIEMQQDIMTILDSNRDSIIIINGDHGPYLTKDCLFLEKYSSDEITQLDIQDRFGTFLAIRWPEKGYEQYDDIVVLQDVFESVFKYLFKTNKILNQSPGRDSIHMNTVIPSGAISDGKITIGKDKGKLLFN